MRAHPTASVCKISLSDSADPDEMRIVRRARRRLVRTEHLLAASAVEKRAGLSPGELRRRVRDGTVFRVRIGRNDFYPALYLRPNRPASRLARISRAMRSMDNAWGMYFELTHRFESLGNRTLLQAMRRATGFRAVMRYARALGGN